MLGMCLVDVYQIELQDISGCMKAAWTLPDCEKRLEEIIDTVADENYRHNHDINLITDNLICDVCKIGEFKPRRTLWKVIKK